MKILRCLLIPFLLTACGGGSPYVGLWQCVNDPNTSLEVKRFEDYFIISARVGEKQYRRDGSFNNDVFSVGANNVGGPMALELDDGKITCTNPPNFCQCNGAYKKVKSLVKPTTSASGSQKDTTAGPVDVVQESGSLTPAQIILNREPLSFELVNGGTVLLFDDVKNKDNEERMFDWSKLTYYYLPRLVFVSLGNGNLAEVRQLDDDVYVYFQLMIQRIDKYELMEKIDESINTKILPNLVVPLSYDEMTVEIAGSRATPIVLTGSDAVFENGKLEISLPVLSESKVDSVEKLKMGQEIATEINDGASVPTASIKIIQQTSIVKTNDGEREHVTKQWTVTR